MLPRLALALLFLTLGCDDEPASAAPAPEATVDAGLTDSAAPDTAPIDARLPDMEVSDAEPPGLRPRFDPAGDGFYDTPWPSDARLTAAGTPDLSLFPAQGAAFLAIVEEIEAHVRGFATMPVAWFAFDEPLTDVRLPSPLESMAADAPIQLLALGDACGERIPIEASVRTEDTRYVAANTLQVKNTVGTVLEPGRPYAVVVLDRFGVAEPAVARQAFVDVWAGDGSAWAASLAPLRDCIAEAGIAPEQIAIATVFTPQDPVAELQAMRDVVMDPTLETRPPLTVERDAAWSRRRLALTTFSGLVEMPVFQDGEPPYLNEGGALVFDADGVPLIQRWEPVPFAVAMRDFAEPPDGPRPALVFIDGTGWNPWGHLRSRWLREILDAGFVVFVGCHLCR